MRNHLVNETSPYLLQHAKNPVDWYPWCDEAFERARQEDKPVFLSIGYSTCHWCHVMAHESFENEGTAAFLNQYFISVKVDREERPDIDSVYMSVCQAFTGRGGWPMSIFMTWEKKPFFAGTYFPVQSGYGMPGFSKLLHAVAERWQSNRSALLASANEITELLRRGQDERKAFGDERGQQDMRKADLKACKGHPEVSGDGPGACAGGQGISAGRLGARAVQQFSASFDRKYGGFGAAPKFPVPHNLLFLMLYAKQNDAGDVLAMVEKTLAQMKKGGIFDQIGGGFCRYSTDPYFLAPHFEKMLYDNALLILAYAAAYVLTDNHFYLDTAERTAAYVLGEMVSPGGGFYSAQDADSEGVEGKYYTFTRAEIMDVLGEERGNAFAKAYDITEDGNFEGASIPNLLKSNAVDADFRGELETLYEYRRNRFRLHLDDKVLLSWNAMMIAALSALYRASGKAYYLEAAGNAQAFIENNLCEELRLFTSWRDGKRMEKGFLDDYAWYSAALLELYHSTLDEAYLAKAQQFCMEAVKRFSDGEGGFYLADTDDAELIFNPKECYDGAVPSGNSVMAYGLVRLYQLTEQDAFGELAKKQLQYLSDVTEEELTGRSMFLLAQLLYENPPEHIVAVLKDASDLERIKARLPFLANVRIVSESAAYPLVNDRTTYYVCKGHVCLAPTNTLENPYFLEK